MQGYPQISQSVLQKHQAQLIPNLAKLAPKSQQMLTSCLTKILTSNSKQQLCELSRKGCLEDAPLLRAHLWKMLLGVMDVSHDKWDKIRSKNSELYQALKNKFLKQFIDEDDLLDFGNNNFDQQLWDQITLDTKRTHSNLNFFQTEVSFGKVYISKPTKHCDMLTRILYIWGKTNQTVRYVQGMNQILAPLYYLQFQFIESKSIHWNRQSQVFFMFSGLMSFVIDMHIKEMDDCQSGIMGRMNMLNRYLRVVDAEIWGKMEKQGIYPQYYSFRWLALFLAQEFGLEETIKLWDHVFSYDGYYRFFFVDSVCISILQFRRKQIMQNDFITSLPLIQKLKDLSVDELIKQGSRLFKKYKSIDINCKYNEIAMTKQEQEPKQCQETKGRTWSYAQIMKNTGNYLGKFKNWAQFPNNK